ncbi:hypothetical protein EWH23_00485 [Meiothermus sp. PNK-Is4]|nr:hypothetical protein EWH23_00485 [Meiothermus sp. PNK-Is4]
MRRLFRRKPWGGVSGRRTAVHPRDDPLSGPAKPVHLGDDPLSGRSKLRTPGGRFPLGPAEPVHLGDQSPSYDVGRAEG